MDEQEFLNGVHTKVNVLQYEREMLEIIQEKQRRYFFRKLKTCAFLFSAVLVLVICAGAFSIDFGVIALVSIALLIVTVWLETNDFDIKKVKMGVKKNGYSYK